MLSVILDFILDILIYAGIPILGMIIGYFVLTRFSDGTENWHDPNLSSDWTKE